LPGAAGSGSHPFALLGQLASATPHPQPHQSAAQIKGTDDVLADQGQLEDVDSIESTIDHDICKSMKMFPTDSSLFETPGNYEKPTNIYLWKQYSRSYFNSRTDKMDQCPTTKHCVCKAQVRISTGDNYKQLDFSGDHNEHTQHSRVNDKSKKYKHRHSFPSGMK
jgi:hypothetical protein